VEETSEDAIDWKELMTPVELRALISLGIVELLRRSSVAFHPGPCVRMRPNDIASFSECLGLLGNCTALIVCVPSRQKADIQDEVRRFVADPRNGVNIFACVGVEDDIITRDDLLFVAPGPADNGCQPTSQSWAHFSVLGFFSRGLKLVLLHVGMSGQQAQKWFLEPHGIKPSVTIFNPE
jgi:hypothetical protein